MTSMNARMTRVFTVVALGFGGIVAMLSWWQILAAGDLQSMSYNNQRAYYEQRIERGLITVGSSTVVATSESRTSANGDDIWVRRYPNPDLAPHVVGYATTGKSRTGIERAWNDYLTGSTRKLASIITKLRGEQAITGDSVRLTINPAGQRTAQTALAGKRGAVVALDPQTGKVLVMASSPTFDPNLVEDQFSQVRNSPGAPLLNRATQGAYPPGSTFKVVTAAAALESGISPDQVFPGGSSVDVASGPPVRNFGGASVGSHTFTYALTNSVNTTFARLGDKLGQDALRSQMETFGMFARPPLDDIPAGERKASGLYAGSQLLDAEAGVDPARVAIGQERLLVTPLQMAIVTATIANEGVRMRPWIVQRITSPSGRVMYRGTPQSLGEAIKPTTARTLSRMMENVVREGTGTAAALQGIDVAGKTGTADTPEGNQVWFIAFAPATDPKVAIAVTVEGQPSGATGGAVAAPIAAQVIDAILQR
jgi:peptidoglycan glycosyltransferase